MPPPLDDAPKRAGVTQADTEASDTDVEVTRPEVGLGSGTDTEETKVEARGAKRATDRPSDSTSVPTREPTGPGRDLRSSASLRRASLADRATSLSVTTLRDTMQSQDAERTRAFVGLAALVCVVVSLPLAFVGGDPLRKWIFVACMLVTASTCGWLYLRLSDPLAYRLESVLWVGYVSIVGAFSGISYFGFFSPAPVVIPFGLYFFGLARSFGGTLLIYLVCAVGYAALAVPIGLGLTPDRGLIPAPDLTTLEVIMVVGAVEVVYFATYAVARLSRRATVNALAEHDRAVRDIAGRDALLYEARMDLEGVLRARGLGRFTDETVGQYRLGEILGRGGMGEVYEARHLDSEEEVAVKLLHAHVLDDDAAVKRFMRECELASRLEVPNVVKVLQTSGPDDAIPYIAMERLRGTDLSDHLRARGRMKMREVLRLIREVGRGLDAAREADIVHRDIKPRNLFFAQPSGGEAVWKILDFGVSKLSTEATFTHAHIVGTPSYMAPEQAQAGEVTHRTDLFSLGVIAYRALTGRPAFSAESPAAILYQVVNEMPPRPSELDPKLTEDVDLVLGIAIAKDPYDRFDSATELADMLEKAAKGRLPDAVRDRARRVLDKKPWAS